MNLLILLLMNAALLAGLSAILLSYTVCAGKLDTGGNAVFFQFYRNIHAFLPAQYISTLLKNFPPSETTEGRHLSFLLVSCGFSLFILSFYRMLRQMSGKEQSKRAYGGMLAGLWALSSLAWFLDEFLLLRVLFFSVDSTIIPLLIFSFVRMPRILRNRENYWFLWVALLTLTIYLFSYLEWAFRLILFRGPADPPHGYLSVGLYFLGLSGLYLAVLLRKQKEKEPQNPYRLSRREEEIIQVLLAGKKNREIAEDLCISKRTVDRHLENIYRKTGFTNRLQLFKHFTRENG